MEGFVTKSHQNFECPKCGDHDHEIDDDEYGGVVFTCSSCHFRAEIVTPMFLGKSDEQIIGYAVTEFTGNPEQPFKMHVLGDIPD